jgi:hypothetical protein
MPTITLAELGTPHAACKPHTLGTHSTQPAANHLTSGCDTRSLAAQGIAARHARDATTCQQRLGHPRCAA